MKRPSAKRAHCDCCKWASLVFTPPAGWPVASWVYAHHATAEFRYWAVK